MHRPERENQFCFKIGFTVLQQSYSKRGTDRETVVVHIEDKVLAHDGKTNNSDISFSHFLKVCSKTVKRKQVEQRRQPVDQFVCIEGSI